ncbi:MAG: histidine kinase dimerization/phosphoacceptor domain -containing protein [Brumimicrobium sp.]
MKQETSYNLNLNEPKTQRVLLSFLDIIHYFSNKVITSKSESDVFNTIINEITPKLDMVDCVIYKVDQETKTIFQVAAYGYKKNKKNIIQNRLKLNFGEGLAGVAARDGKSILVQDVTKEKDYLKDILEAGSEIEVPIKINDKVYAVISSEHPTKGFYNEFHIKFFEILASITVGTLVKIQEKEELQQIKHRLESILEKKSTDLDRAIDALSSQYSELKHQHDKRELLIQEVHHRVNNNLQIISSILRLYLTESDENSSKELQEIHDRVQAMALIHQNIYKSLEMNLVDVSSYIRDLMNHLKGMNSTTYISFEQEVDFKHINLNTLVPLGLYITELVSAWINLVVNEAKETEIHFKIKLGECKNKNQYELLISDNINDNIFKEINLESDTDISSILITALVEQLEGKINITNKNDCNLVKLCFDPV